ncbi:hypothetical protein L211DRAFT_854349 [Terfezia boudieri ATCC MYA-4762]|uniref:Uncharacterized protein n=1 Tax=Terfezia boudieri ATCC MYA-4762 TaxID=1051890 RepID=A0A3N4L5M7_9PEZI|nr:hypothetical protein L211DRAFT_854349 [Terfezia boudieri ATCC MYA-4762]
MRIGSPRETYELPNSGNPAVLRYNEIRQTIIEYLDRSTQVFVVTLVIASSTRLPSVQVGIGIHENQTNDFFTPLQQLCDGASLGLMTGRIKINLSGTPSDPGNARYEEYVNPGASIGVQGRKGTASFGCYLKDRNSDKIYGITCAHPFTIYGEDEKVVTAQQLLEILPVGTIVTQPSDDDVKYIINEKEEFVNQQIVKIGKMESSEYPERERRRLEKEKKAQQEQEDLLLELKDASKVFGTTSQFYELASVPSHSNKGYLWDYLLIEVDDERKGDNTIDRFLCNSYRRLDHGLPCKMVGRTSGRKKGEIGEIKCDLKGVPRFPGEVFALHTVKAVDRGRFNVPGDSGCLCRYDGEEKLNTTILGMLFMESECVEGTLLDIGFLHDFGGLLDRIKEKWALDLELC